MKYLKTWEEECLQDPGQLAPTKPKQKFQIIDNIESLRNTFNAHKKATYYELKPISVEVVIKANK